MDVAYLESNRMGVGVPDAQSLAHLDGEGSCDGTVSIGGLRGGNGVWGWACGRMTTEIERRTVEAELLRINLDGHGDGGAGRQACRQLSVRSVCCGEEDGDGR